MAETGYRSFNTTVDKTNHVLKEIEQPYHWPKERRNQSYVTLTAVRVPALLRFLALMVPVAPLNLPVPPVTLPLVTMPFLVLMVSAPYRKPPVVSTVTCRVRKQSRAPASSPTRRRAP